MGSKKAMPKAVPCKLKSCKRTIRPDNATFPYCHDHFMLKDARSTIVDFNNYSMEYIRETLYNPERSKQGTFNYNVDYIHNVSKIKNDVVAHTYLSWVKLVKENNINASSPIDSFNSRDFMLSNMEDIVKNDYDTKRIYCNSGSIYIPGIGKTHSDNHVVILCEKGDEEFILDPSTASPLHNIEEELNENNKSLSTMYQSGELTNLDGYNIANIFHYSHFSSVSFLTMKDKDGNVYSSNEFHNDDADIRIQRELVNSRNYIPSVGVIKNSFIEKTINPLYNTGELQQQYVEEEDLTIEDILNRY